MVKDEEVNWRRRRKENGRRDGRKMEKENGEEEGRKLRRRKETGEEEITRTEEIG